MYVYIRHRIYICIFRKIGQKLVAEGGVLYGALNHAAGVGWVARVGVGSGGASARQAFIYIYVCLCLYRGPYIDLY